MNIRFSQLARLLNRVAYQEDGGEVVEYVIVLGMVIVATIATLFGFGNKLVARWTSINNSM